MKHKQTCCCCCCCGRGTNAVPSPAAADGGGTTDSMINSPLRVRQSTPSRPPTLSTRSLRLVGVSLGSLQLCRGVGSPELRRSTTEPFSRLDRGFRGRAGEGGGGAQICCWSSSYYLANGNAMGAPFEAEHRFYTNQQP